MQLIHLLHPHSGWLQGWSERLSIRQKIGFGYGLALSVAVLGTTAGLVVGDLYLQKAQKQMRLADQEMHLLSRFQGALLGMETHEHEFVSSLFQPQQFQAVASDFKLHLQEAKALLAELQEFNRATSPENLKPLLQKYDTTINLYFTEIQTLIEQLSLLVLQPQAMSKAQQFMLKFDQSTTAIELEEFTHDLNNLAKKVRQHKEQATVAFSQATALQAQIIISSILLSTAIAFIIAFYTTRAIAHPILSVAHVAQQVTKDSNFDIQAPITTKDEVGELATSFNQLIQQVKHLLAAQKAEAETRLLQSEKMSSLGRMMTGVAHEINNPVNFISANLNPAQEYITDLLALVSTYKAEVPHPPEAVQAKAEEIDLEFLEVDLPKLLQSMQVGCDRLRPIVLSLKDFSRLDEGTIQLVDLRACIDSTLLILNNRLKKGVNVVRNYGDISVISGYTGLLYQVWMNLLSNALDSLEEKLANHNNFLPEITITTECLDNDWVTVRIADNGLGIATETQSKIFDAFFTTKPRGVGTGLGLAICQQIIVEKHGGKIMCHSELHKGTEFVIALPSNQH